MTWHACFIDYVHNYRKVDEYSWSISIWSFVVIIFGTMRFYFDTAFHVYKMLS